MGLGATEIIIILAVVLLFFGGKKLPALGNSLGKAVTNFKKGLNDKDDTLNS
ncbi:MAG: Sec-independent protein translocase subunit TatA/TatB [Bacteriovoracaceae bacterium]